MMGGGASWPPRRWSLDAPEMHRRRTSPCRCTARRNAIVNVRNVRLFVGSAPGQHQGTERQHTRGGRINDVSSASVRRRDFRRTAAWLKEGAGDVGADGPVVVLAGAVQVRERLLVQQRLTGERPVSQPAKHSSRSNSHRPALGATQTTGQAVFNSPYMQVVAARHARQQVHRDDVLVDGSVGRGEQRRDLILARSDLRQSRTHTHTVMYPVQ